MMVSKSEKVGFFELEDQRSYAIIMALLPLIVRWFNKKIIKFFGTKTAYICGFSVKIIKIL